MHCPERDARAHLRPEVPAGGSAQQELRARGLPRRHRIRHRVRGAPVRLLGLIRRRSHVRHAP